MKGLKVTLSPAFLFIARPRVLAKDKDGNVVYGITIPKRVADAMREYLYTDCYVAISPIDGHVEEVVGDD